MALHTLSTCFISTIRNALPTYSYKPESIDDKSTLDAIKKEGRGRVGHRWSKNIDWIDKDNRLTAKNFN
jgi:hypothetical protein